MKSFILNLYNKPVGSSGSGRIWHTGSAIGSVMRSSAKSGAPRKPSGFLSRALTESLMPEPALANVHWMSVTVTNKSVYLHFWNMIPMCFHLNMILKINFIVLVIK